ncbi:hypothetical protein HOLleu_21702 [Holothuria leucospilota]|uniref:G-protein coupled receptors family 1 profile domain-containing protein n=1 Tax=Holothuria leucospilota TaxID=206669 RepID=A0A9Q1H6N3_HOLLE|nr:hypothetical protein HOLleu_21702 [Holothuria leucospilota]
MLPNDIVRAILWGVSSFSLLANFVVITSRLKSKNFFVSKLLILTTVNSGQNMFLVNLALSDFLMGVYLFAIGSADAYFGKGYIVSAFNWRTGVTCKVIGFIGVVSNVASLLILTLISIERFSTIVLPFYRLRFGSKLTKITCAIVWGLSIVMALTPIILADFVEGIFGFSDICSGLPFVTIAKEEDREITTKYEDGIIKEITGSNDVPKSQWIYSQIVYIYFSATCVSVVTICYVSMFISVMLTRHMSGRQANNAEEVKMATKMSIIVLTDLFCWVPIIIAGVLTETGMEISTDMYAWFVVVVMPINSALNPLLYTVPLIKKKKKNKPSFIGEQKEKKKKFTEKLRNNWIP